MSIVLACLSLRLKEELNESTAWLKVLEVYQDIKAVQQCIFFMVCLHKQLLNPVLLCCMQMQNRKHQVKTTTAFLTHSSVHITV